MMHKPIQIIDLGLSFNHKTCFEHFNAQIPYGSRIAIMGRNGLGKTSLLQVLRGAMAPTSGEILGTSGIVFGFVPQLIEDFPSLSGGQRLNKALTTALNLNPDVLLLDEPSNHLDKANRKSLLRMLQFYPGTLIMVSHDKEFLSQSVDTLWEIEQAEIHIFKGNYKDYRAEKAIRKKALLQSLDNLSKEKKEMHQALMKEQQRAAKSRQRGEKNIEQRKWPTIVSSAKARRSEETTGRKKSLIDEKKSQVLQAISELHLAETIVPKFSLKASDLSDETLVTLSDGLLQYQDEDSPLLQDIHFAVRTGNRVLIEGPNGSGKSTLVKALRGDFPGLIKSGVWLLPNPKDIGYLDQHYATLDADKTVFETIQDLLPQCMDQEIRCHLNDFLFRKNEEVEKKVALLSGGEKARLSLAQIAANTPKLLILDEITNNLDLETKEHVLEILKAYPGALLIISHEKDFIEELGIDETINVEVFKA